MAGSGRPLRSELTEAELRGGIALQDFEPQHLMNAAWALARCGMGRELEFRKGAVLPSVSMCG